MKLLNAVKLRQYLKVVHEKLKSGEWKPEPQDVTYLNHLANKLTSSNPRLKPMEGDMLRYLYHRAIEAPPSDAVKAFCLECGGDCDFVNDPENCAKMRGMK